MILWHKEALDTVMPHWQPFKGHAADTSSRCRKLNSRLQMHQPLWKHMEKISAYKKQLKDIEDFQLMGSKRKPLVSENCSEIDRDGVDDAVDFSFSNDREEGSSLGHFSFDVQCSYRPKPDIVSLGTAYSPWGKSKKSKARLSKEFEDISEQMKVAANEILKILKESKIEGDLPFLPGPVGESPLHACFLLGLRHLGMKIVNEYYNTPELLSVPYFTFLDKYDIR